MQESDLAERYEALIANPEGPKALLLAAMAKYTTDADYDAAQTPKLLRVLRLLRFVKVDRGGRARITADGQRCLGILKVKGHVAYDTAIKLLVTHADHFGRRLKLDYVFPEERA